MTAGFTRKILEPRRTLGNALKKQRFKRKYTLKKAARSTLIRYSYLFHLENNEFKFLPPEPYGSFFVKRYAEFLGLDPDYYVLWYQREVNVLPSDNQVSPPEEIKFSFWGFVRRRLRYLFLTLIILFALSSFLVYEVIGFAKGPNLKIISPSSQEFFVKEPLYQIRGITDQESVVSLNGKLLDTNKGVFEEEVILKPGKNQFVIESSNNLNKKTKINLIIWRN